MKTITQNYKLSTNGKKLSVSLLALFRAVGLEGEVTPAEVPASVLDTLRVRLASPGVTGAVELSTDSSKACYYSIEGNVLTVSLAGLSGGVHRLSVLTKYGTNTRALLLVDLDVPQNVLFIRNGSTVLMPLIRDTELDGELDGVSYYGFSYPYGEKKCWLTTAKPIHLREKVTALYTDDADTVLADATALTDAHVVENAGVLVYDTANAEAIQLGAVDTFGSTGGGTADAETVLVHLNASGTVDWENLSVRVVLESEGGTEQTYELNANGECTFQVPFGEVYTIIYPIIEDYAQMNDETFTSLMVARTIERTYAEAGTKYEKVEIFGRVITSESEYLGILVGQTVTITTTDEDTYTAQFDEDNHCSIDVPYGKVYTVHLPNISGWDHEHAQITYTAGITSRELLVHYSQVTLGIFAIDADGNTYEKEELEALDDKSGIVAIGVNTSALALADRGDGTYGCGFAIKLTPGNTGKQWATDNVQFDTTRLPFYSTIETASGDYKGVMNTLYMRQIAEELLISSPAADYCNQQTLTIANVERNGFLGSFGQLYVLSQNYSAVAEMFTLCGKTMPNINSGSWWSSSQYTATYACLLNSGGFNGSNKTNSNSVLPFFDL